MSEIIIQKTEANGVPPAFVDLSKETHISVSEIISRFQKIYREKREEAMYKSNPISVDTPLDDVFASAMNKLKADLTKPEETSDTQDTDDSDWAIDPNSMGFSENDLSAFDDANNEDFGGGFDAFGGGGDFGGDFGGGDFGTEGDFGGDLGDGSDLSLDDGSNTEMPGDGTESGATPSNIDSASEVNADTEPAAPEPSSDSEPDEEA